MLGVLLGIGVLAALISLYAAICLYAYASLWLAGISLRAKLASRNRVISVGEAKQFLATGQGTFFLEAPSIGWPVLRVWWAPPGVIVETREDEPAGADHWADSVDHRNYASLVHLRIGQAKLIEPFVFLRRADKYMRKNFQIEEPPVRVLSGEVTMGLYRFPTEKAEAWAREHFPSCHWAAALVGAVVSHELGMDVRQLRPSTRFIEDLDASSELQDVELIRGLEEVLRRKIPPEDAARLRTISDAVDYVTRRLRGHAGKDFP